MVVGLGKAGLPLYELLRECGKFLVYGFDIDEAKMSGIERAIVRSMAEVRWRRRCNFSFSRGRWNS